MSGFDLNKLEGDRSKKKARTNGEEQPWGSRPESHLTGRQPALRQSSSINQTPEETAKVEANIGKDYRRLLAHDAMDEYVGKAYVPPSEGTPEAAFVDAIIEAFSAHGSEDQGGMDLDLGLGSDGSQESVASLPRYNSEMSSQDSSASYASDREFSDRPLNVGDVVTILTTTKEKLPAEFTGDADEDIIKEGVDEINAVLDELVAQPPRFDLDNQIDDAFNELMAAINDSFISGVQATGWVLLKGLTKLLGLIGKAVIGGAKFAWYYPKITTIILGFAYLQYPFCAFLIKKTLGFAWWVVTTLGGMTTAGQAIAAGYEKLLLFIYRAAEIVEWCKMNGITTFEAFQGLVANVGKITEQMEAFKLLADKLNLTTDELLALMLSLSEAFGANAAAGAAPSFFREIMLRIGGNVGGIAVGQLVGRIGAAAAAAGPALMPGGGKRKNKKKNTRKNKKKKTVTKRRKQQRKSKRR